MKEKEEMNLNLFVRKVCSDGNRRDRVGDQARRKPLALMKTGGCLWINQSHSPGGNQVMSTGSSRSQRLTANLSMRRNLTSVS